MKKFHDGIKLEDQNPFQKQRITDLTTRFNRWHDKQMALLTFLINLFFALSIATLGLVVNNFKNELFSIILWDSYSLAKLTAVILFISIIFGVIALLMRFYDFRATKNTVKFRKLKFRIEENLKYEYDESETRLTAKFCLDKITKFQSIARCLGKLTGFFFYVQLALYLTSLILIVCSL